MKEETLQLMVVTLIVSALIVLLAVLGILISKHYNQKSEGPQVSKQDETTVVTITSAVSQDEAASLLYLALEKKLSGLDVKRVHDMIGTQVAEIASTQTQWVEADLLLAIENVVDQAILGWVEEKIIFTAEQQGYTLSSAESRDLRDQFYFGDWLHFMSYYEIASLKNAGTLVIKQP